MIYRHILRRTRHTRNYTHKTVLKAQSNLHKCALIAQLNYTNVLSWHNGKLHICAVGTQWNTTHLCSRNTVEYYTLVLSEHSGILHTCAVGTQWNTTHLCSHGTTLHTKSPMSGRLTDHTAISGANGCGCRH